MLRIKKTHIKFLKGLHLGVRTFCIELSEFGFEEEVMVIAEAAASFSYVSIFGDEPFKHTKDISELCKQIQKLNPRTHIIIHTAGLIRPTGMNTVQNVEYIIACKLKASGVSFDDRINEITWNWLAKADGKFIFKIDKEEDLDEINVIVSALTIHKSQIYIDIIGGDFKNLAFIILGKGYNLYIDFDGELYHEDD